MSRWSRPLPLLAVALGLAAAPLLLAADASEAPRIGLEEFRTALTSDTVVAIDVRAPEAYRNGHIPGSLSVPLAQLQAWSGRLVAMKKPIVAYCA